MLFLRNTLRPMPHRSILFFGRNQAMMTLVGQQLQAAGLSAQGFLDEALLLSELDKGNTRLLVIGGGVEDEARERLRDRCKALNILVLEHFGGPTALVDTIGSLLG